MLTLCCLDYGYKDLDSLHMLFHMSDLYLVWLRYPCGQRSVYLFIVMFFNVKTYDEILFRLGLELRLRVLLHCLNVIGLEHRFSSLDLVLAFPS